MNRRVLALSLTAAAVLAAIAIVLWGSGDEGTDDQSASGGGGDALTAIKPGSTERDLAVEPVTPDPVPEPVEVTPRTLVMGETMLPLTAEQIEETLDQRGRAASDLIAAQAVMGDYSYLQEAAERFPDDPEVQFWVIANDVFPGERAQWIERYKESQPDNALPNLLAAQEAFRAQDPEAALAELRAAAGKEFSDPTSGLRSEVNEFYRGTGAFDDDAALFGSARAGSNRHIEKLQSLSSFLIQEHQRLVQEGDDERAAEIADLGMDMLKTVGENVGGDSLGSRTMLLFMQENLQRAAGDPGGFLDDLAAERQRVANLGRAVDEIFADPDVASDELVAEYGRLLHTSGDIAAAEWLVEQVGDPLAPEPHEPAGGPSQ